MTISGMAELVIAIFLFQGLCVSLIVQWILGFSGARMEKMGLGSEPTPFVLSVRSLQTSMAKGSYFRFPPLELSSRLEGKRPKSHPGDGGFMENQDPGAASYVML